MNFGFGWIGLVFSLCVLAPNIVYLFFKPNDEKIYENKTAPFFSVLEWIGRVACLILPCIFAEYGSTAFDSFSAFCILAFLCIILYWTIWCRYFFGKHTMQNLYRPLGKMVVPLAIFPVVGFLMMGIWGKNFFLVLASLIFALGHIVNAWLVYDATRQV